MTDRHNLRQAQLELQLLHLEQLQIYLQQQRLTLQVELEQLESNRRLVSLLLPKVTV